MTSESLAPEIIRINTCYRHFLRQPIILSHILFVYIIGRHVRFTSEFALCSATIDQASKSRVNHKR